MELPLRAPHLNWEEKVIYHLPDDEFKKEIVELGGTSPEIFKHRELEKVYLPILRADFRITNTYQFVPGGRLDCGITVFYGDREFIPDTDINAWQDYSARQCRIVSFPSDHFFINEYKDKIVAVINETAKTGNVS